MLKIGIIGQGIAGMVLALTLRRRGCRVVVFDDDNPGSPSAVAAGIVNPITGQRFVKTWMADALLPAAREFYRSIGQELGIEFFQEKKIIRLLGSPHEENEWSSRCSLPDNQEFMQSRTDAGAWRGLLRPGFVFGEISQAAQLDFKILKKRCLEKWAAEGCLLPGWRSYAELEKLAAEFDCLVFCEGFFGRDNPFFPGIGWQAAKGQVLLLQLPVTRNFELLKKKIMLAPLAKNLVWAGSTNEWNFEDERPTEQGKQFILNELHEILDAPFEVIGHLAAIRPTLKDRRPVLGFSPADPRFGIFNGMGTKGSMLAPYWAAAFAEHILEGKALPEEVSFSRFKP